MERVYVSIGSNIDRESNIQKAVAQLNARFGNLIESRVYESTAVGFQGENFFNQVIGFDTEDSTEDVALALREIETQMGRSRTDNKFLSRTVDLDLLLYGDLIITTKNYSIPRSEITEHAFVLMPLAEVAGEQRHPTTGLRYKDLWESFNHPDQKIWLASSSSQL